MCDTYEVTASDGVQLAVWADGPTDAPVLVCVHGYPDDHSVWDGVSAALSGTYRVVRYDVRGAGRSGRPSARSGYVLDQLAADLSAVIESTGAQRVQLLAHDWGSIQSWHAVGDPAIAARVAAYTSISGPDLGMAEAYYRSLVTRRRYLDAVRGLAHSWYIGVFLTPGLPEFGWRHGLVASRLPRGGGSGSTEDGIRGLELYRANFGPRGGRHTARRVDVPVQVLAPMSDVYVTPALQTEAPIPFVEQLRTERIRGHHWTVVRDPAAIAERVTAWAEAHPA